MKNKLYLKSISLLATSIIPSSFSICCSITPSVQDIKITNITLYGATMEKNQSLLMQPLITPKNATNQTLTWESSDTSIAEVSSTGVVSTKANGEITITAKTTDGSNKSAQATITITDFEEPKEYISDRTLSICGKNTVGQESIIGTAWIVSDSTPTVYDDYNYYVATNWHVWQNIINHFGSTPDVYMSNNGGSLRLLTDYFKVDTWTAEQKEKFYFDTTPHSSNYYGIDLYVLNVDLSNATDKTKFNKLNQLQQSKGYITQFVDPTTDSKNYLSDTMYTGGYPNVLYGTPTWEFHCINKANEGLSYQKYNTQGYIHETQTTPNILDISPQYCAESPHSQNYMSGGASGSMLIGEYESDNGEKEYKVAGIYWGGFSSKSHPEWYFPEFSIFRSDKKDFISDYI